MPYHSTSQADVLRSTTMSNDVPALGTEQLSTNIVIQVAINWGTILGDVFCVGCNGKTGEGEWSILSILLKLSSENFLNSCMKMMSIGA